MKIKCFLSLALLVMVLMDSCDNNTEEPPRPDDRPALTVSEQSREFFENGISFPSSPEGKEAQTQTITFTAAESWDASVVEDTKSSTWLAVEPSSGNPGTVNMTVTAQPNETSHSRAAMVIIKSGKETMTVTVSQKPKTLVKIIKTENVSWESAWLYAQTMVPPEQLHHVAFYVSSSADFNPLGPSLENISVIWASSIGSDGVYRAYVNQLKPNATYYFKVLVFTVSPEGADYAGDTYVSGETGQFTTTEFEIAGVDMGLSVKWRNTNLGAEIPFQDGDFYAWGETESKESYTWASYKWCEGQIFTFTKYNSGEYYGPVVDNKSELAPEDDAARVKLGGKWRMPTAAEVQELVDTQSNPDYYWFFEYNNPYEKPYTQVIYLVNGNSLIFPDSGAKNDEESEQGNTPSAGVFWTSTLDEVPYDAYYLRTDCDWENYHPGGVIHLGTAALNRIYRYYGLPIRPVLDE